MNSSESLHTKCQVEYEVKWRIEMWPYKQIATVDSCEPICDTNPEMQGRLKYALNY